MSFLPPVSSILKRKSEPDSIPVENASPAPTKLDAKPNESIGSSIPSFREFCVKFAREEETIRQASESPTARERQHKLKRLTARERLAKLLDQPNDFFELELWAGHRMYTEWGDTPAAGVIVGIGKVSCRSCLIIANDASVKAGAFFPATAKKVIRAQRIGFECALPIIYLVDSAGVFLPLQDELFPDEDDFGRVFRNNAVISAAGIPQFAAIMGNCVAGGAYLPVLCDKILMTEGSGLYLAGPSLVKAAIGQEVSSEDLGGAKMHAEISGTIDFREKDDEACIDRLRKLVDFLPQEKTGNVLTAQSSHIPLPSKQKGEPKLDPQTVYELVNAEGSKPYDMRQLLDTIIDADSQLEFKADYGQTLVTMYARIDGQPVGIVGNQRLPVRTKKDGIQMGGVIYADSADKAARFVMDCNQTQIPLLFFQDVQGFMVGQDAEESGIIRNGAKLVNAVSNSVVPKITVIVGGSFGAGNYALCGKAYDPRFIIAWPNARYAVMGAAQASGTVYSLLKRKSKAGNQDSTQEDEALREKVHRIYQEQTDIRYGAARGWVDAIIQPHETRACLKKLLKYVSRPMPENKFHMGVVQV